MTLAWHHDSKTVLIIVVVPNKNNTQKTFPIRNDFKIYDFVKYMIGAIRFNVCLNLETIVINARE